MLCGIAVLATDREIFGINAFIKPLKFFISVAITSWSLGYLLYELKMPKAVKRFNLMAIVALSFELVAITLQAARGQLSHFNVSTLPNMLLFQAMGLVIVVFTLWVGWFALAAFRKPLLHLSPNYRRGIRWGLMLFVIFALEGGLMGALLRHTVGSTDGGHGMAFLNWSKAHGDLRVAHFFGLHSLQIIPFAGFLLRKKAAVWFWIALVVYVAFVVWMLVGALMGMSL